MAKTGRTSGSISTLRRMLKRPRYRYMAVNRIVPHLPWFVLLAIAVFFFKARIFADSGFYLAQLINNQTFWIGTQHILSGLPQLITLIGVWTGLEIKYILLIFSVSPVLFFYLLFLFVYYGLRDRRSGLLILLSQTVGIVYGFFSPMFELYYTVPLLITFYAIWKLHFRFGAIWVLLILEALIIFSHPLAPGLFAFILLFDYRKETAKPIKFYVPVILVFIAIAGLNYYLNIITKSAQAGLIYTYVEDKPYLLLQNLNNFKDIAFYTLRYFPEILAALILVIFMLINTKQWIRLTLITVTFVVYVVYINSKLNNTNSISLEEAMYTLFPIVFIPLIYGFPIDRRQGLLNISILLISAVIAFRLVVIYYTSEIFVKRVAQMEQLIEAARQKGGSKFVVSMYAVDHGYTKLNWSYSIETMLLSAFAGNDISVTIAPEEDLTIDAINENIAANQFIFRKGELKNQSWLNKRYFHLDIGSYRTLNDSTLNSNMSLTGNNLRITMDTKKIYQAIDTVWIPVTIVNRGDIPVYSGKKNNVFLSYFWVVNNDVLSWNELRTPLQADIAGTMRQDVKVAVPRNKGRMQLKIDIIANDQWLGINCQEDVLVY